VAGFSFALFVSFAVQAFGLRRKIKIINHRVRKVREEIRGAEKKTTDTTLLRFGKLSRGVLASRAMDKLLAVSLCMTLVAFAADLPSKKYLNLAAIKSMVSSAEAEAERQHVSVTICIVDESGNLLFLERGDGVSVNTLQWAQKKARHAAFYRSPSKDAAETIKKGSMEALAYPEFFPNQGGLPIIVDGQLLGGISASGAKSETDEAIAQAGLDALLKK
jgi:glc operon protein GlcG